MQHAQFVTTVTVVCPTCNQDSKIKVARLFPTKDDWAHKLANDSSLFNKKQQASQKCMCEACGMGIKATLEFHRGVFTHLVEPDDSEYKKDIMTLVVLPPQTEPVYFLMNSTGYHFASHNNGPGIDLDRDFMINENSCPTNWFGDFERIQIGHDADPHGMILHVRSMLTEDFEAIEKQVRKEMGMEKYGGSTTELDRAIMERAFPEVAQRFIPDGYDFEAYTDKEEVVLEQHMREVSDRPYRQKSFYGEEDYFFANIKPTPVVRFIDQ